MIGNRSRTGFGVLSDEQVLEIRERLQAWKDNSPSKISEETGISIHVIRGISQDRIYNHVNEFK